MSLTGHTLFKLGDRRIGLAIAAARHGAIR